MEVLLANDIYFVEGYKNAAIYNLNTKEVYAVNELGKKAIIKYLNNEENSDKEKFIQNLINKKIIVPEEINKEIKIKRTELKIKFAWLELTGNCNLKCIHCYGKFGYNINDSSKELKINDWKQIINELTQMGCQKIQLIGGEPCCNKTYRELIEYIYKSGIKDITIFTNATMINDEDIKIFKRYQVKIRFSLYGHNDIVHEKITQVKGSFEKTIKNIKKLKENKIFISAAVVIMKDNEKYINEIKNFIVNDLGIKYNGYDVIRPSCINDNLENRIKDYNVLANRYNIKPRFYITKSQFYINHYYNPCLNSKVAITTNGDVIPCIFSRNCIAGNIKEKSLIEIEEEIIKTWECSKEKIDECRDCEFKYACSDCRPLAIGINGNEKSKYPRCCYQPKEGKWEEIKKIQKEIIEGVCKENGKK